MLHDPELDSTRSPLLQALSLFGDLTEVTGIDVGFLPIAQGDAPLGLRIHVATPADVLRLHQSQHIPNTLDGLRLMLIPSQFKAQQISRVKYPNSVKYTVHCESLGQLVHQVLAHQHPLTGRDFLHTGCSGLKGKILSPTAQTATKAMLLELNELQQQIIQNPSAPAPILCYQKGHFPGTDHFEVNIANIEAKPANTTLRVDGCGFYAHQTDREQHLIPGIRALF